MESFGNNKKSVKEMFLTIMNGGFKVKYSKNFRINNYLKLLEKEVIKIQEYFYSKGKRYFEKGYNYMGKNLSRIILDIENKILQTMINYFVLKRVNIFTLEYDGLKIYTDDKSKHFSMNDLQKIVLEKTGINIKLAFMNIEDSFPNFEIKVSTDNIINENLIENKMKVIHHDHALEKNNILGFICRECNLQIKNDKKISLYFFNGSKYDISILLKSLCDMYKDEMTMKCIGNSSENFKSVNFKFKNMRYSFKLLDICNFLKGSLSSLSENLSDECKIITKHHFPDHFELLKEKACFPYEWLREENLYDKRLPAIDKFYSSLKLQNISKKDYDKTIEIFNKLKCKNVKDYLEIYMKLDICVQVDDDIFNVFKNTIWDKFKIDCTKYITGCSLSLDLMLKYTGVKIQLFKDITMFDFVDFSIMGGLCVASENIADDDDGESVISSCDVCSLYPYVMSQKLPISNYKFVSNFDKTKYGQDKDYSCLLNVEIYTTKKILNNKTLSQFPALISKSIIKYDLNIKDKI